MYMSRQNSPEETEEIFYLIGYHKKSGKWRSADELLGFLVHTAVDGDGPVQFVNEDGEIEWRNFADDIERDVDFDNAQEIGAFLRAMNGESPD